jgi:DNA-binding NarL/FixJ family response regulator
MNRTSTSRSPAARPASARPKKNNTAQPAEAAHPLLLAASLHDRPLPIAWLEHFAIPDSGIDALLGSALLIETDDGLTLGPALDREAVSKSATFSQRRRAHLTLAEACLRPTARFEAAAQHFESAGKPAEAARAWLRAGEAHSRRHRHTAACNAFASALRLLSADTPDADIVPLLQNLERCAALGHTVAGTLDTLRNWSESPPWSARPAIRAAASLALAALLAHEARHVESARVRICAARDLAILGRTAASAEAFIAAAATLAYALQFTLALKAIAEAVPLAEKCAAHAALASALQLRGFILGMQGHTAEGRADVENALDLALRHQLPGLAADAYRLLGNVAEYNSCYRDEQTAFARALSYCRRHDQHVVAGLCLGCLAYSFFRSGNWKRCEQIVRRVLADKTVHPVSRLVADGVLGLLHAHRGEPRPAAKLLSSSLAGGTRMGLGGMNLFSLLGLAVTADLSGDAAQSAAHYRAIFDAWRASEDRHDAIPGLSCAVQFHAERGERDPAAEYAATLEEIAAATANPEASGAARLAVAELLLLDGQHAAAIAAFRSALDDFEKRDLSLERIRVRLRLAFALSKTAALDEARALLTDAIRRARRLGARPLAAKATALLDSLKAASGNAAPPSSRTWDLLSARQRDTARHLALGATNKEIATALGLSVRTVEMHVADVLARLDCRSRSHAAARIATELS